jgi:hypothetical protein
MGIEIAPYNAVRWRDQPSDIVDHCIIARLSVRVENRIAIDIEPKKVL